MAYQRALCVTSAPLKNFPDFFIIRIELFIIFTPKTLIQTTKNEKIISDYWHSNIYTCALHWARC